jgi:HAD superfamily phosphatase (TIGR01668 family)
LLRFFLPTQQVNSIFDIQASQLLEKGIKGIITDLDNTLVEWDRALATPEIVSWFKEMMENGITVTIISNNNEKRVRSFSDPIGIPFVHSARKPMGKAFEKALRDMGLKKSEIVVIGDQLLTDILGGNLLGLHTILVIPVSQSDGLLTRFNRKVERSILRKLKRKGLIKWEE